MFAIDQAAPGFTPEFSGGRSPLSVEIWFAQANDDGLILTGTAGTEPVAQVLAPGWSGLLIADRIGLQVAGGCGDWRAADIAALAKLQAFMDAGRASPQDGDGDGNGESDSDGNAGVAADAPGLTALEMTYPRDVSDRRSGERWFLMQSLYPSIEFKHLSAVLRRSEWYKLVRFLLAQPASVKMRQLSARYGLSYSYFRHLCRQALGRSVKAEILQWRNVRALLDMADGGGNLTEIALRQGFSSSAHFSGAMKSQFGMAPRSLMRASLTDTE